MTTLQMRSAIGVAALTLLASCKAAAPSRSSSADQPRVVDAYDPPHDVGPLFERVQLGGLFDDSKTFVDSNFDIPRPVGGDFRTDTTQAMEAHIRALWPVLTRAADTADARSSRIPLPNAYVVPGGRFREVYYWDSYFTMLGLVESGRTDLVKDMLDNFAHLVATIGHIPNGNRTYCPGPRQPPFFAA